jgi:hypothetical protein
MRARIARRWLLFALLFAGFVLCRLTLFVTGDTCRVVVVQRVVPAHRRSRPSTSNTAAVSSHIGVLVGMFVLQLIYHRWVVLLARVLSRHQ